MPAAKRGELLAIEFDPVVRHAPPVCEPLYRPGKRGEAPLDVKCRQRSLQRLIVRPPPHDLFGASLARPSVAQLLAPQVIGVNNFADPGLPSGVDRDFIGQLPSGFWVATR